jgi:hypothetical protein
MPEMATRRTVQLTTLGRARIRQDLADIAAPRHWNPTIAIADGAPYLDCYSDMALRRVWGVRACPGG